MKNSKKTMWNFSKRIIALFLLLCLSLSVVACSGSTGSGSGGGDKTTIYIANTGGGVGELWLQQAKERFIEKYADKLYNGKPGVDIDIYSSTAVNTANMSTDGYTMYFTERSGTARNLSQAQLTYDLTNIVTEKIYENGTKAIVDYVEPSFLSALKGADGQYYALPHFEIYPTLTYNRYIFDKYGIYFAAPDAVGAEDYTCIYGNAKIVGQGGENVKKSCGIDGEYFTDDDGLPTSLQELLILCNYMYNENNVVPFTVAGGHIDYHNYFTEGIMSSIMGKDSFLGMFSFDTEVEVVTGYSDQNLFQGVDYVKKPNTATVKLTNENGYLTREIAARYYAAAMTEICEKNLWFSSDSTSGNSTHSVTQDNFVLGGVRGKKEIGILIEGSQWVNETIQTGTFEDYKTFTTRESDLGIMPFPVSVNTTITEGNGKKHTVMDFGTSYMFVSQRIANDEGLKEAVKDFIQFIYSEAELQNFTKVTGVLKASMNYNYATDEIMNNLLPLQKEILRYRKNGDMVLQTSNNDLFYAGWGDFIMAIDAPMFRGSYDNNTTVSNYLSAVRNGKTARQIFENFFISQAAWNSRFSSYFQGE